MLNILGVSASLRNARYGKGSEKLLSEIKKIPSKKKLIDFLSSQINVRAQDFFEAGRKDNKSFDIIYKKLTKLNGENGLSNSEAALVAALWGASQQSVGIDHLPLSDHFSPTGKVHKLTTLREKVLKADAILLSTPVYFGDRSSLSQTFIEFLYKDEEIKAHLKNKLYAGLSVGAKRNGGQETTLIYQIIDMINLNMLAVGNDSETTSQYGGTVVAGDIGTICEDTYGLDTCIGTGKRLAETTKLINYKSDGILEKSLTVDLWLLQDDENRQGHGIYTKWIKQLRKDYPDVNFRLLDFTESYIGRCIACDICPIASGNKEEYRCIITKKSDLFKQNHVKFLQADAVLLCAYSPKNRVEVKSVYQKFIERTRYFRRDDYVFSNLLMAPFVISEISANQNLHIRMLTSAIRHHTILHHPLVGFELEKKMLNFPELVDQGRSFLKNAIKIKQNSKALKVGTDTKYNPIGYIISLEKMKQEALS